MNRGYPVNRLLLAHPADDFAVISFSRLQLEGAKARAEYVEKVRPPRSCWPAAGIAGCVLLAGYAPRHYQ